MTSVIDEIKQITGISLDTHIRYKSDIEAIKQVNSSLKDSKDYNSVGPSKESIVIDVKESFDPEALSVTYVSQHENRPIIYDRSTGLEIRPVYVDTDVEITIEYKSISKTDIWNWENSIRVKLSQHMDMLLHDVKYDYLMPDPVGNLIKEVYDKSESVDGYGIDFQEYLTRHSDGRLRWISDQAKKHFDITVEETQSRIVGTFDFSPIPDKPEYDSESSKWVMTFVYKFKYQKPLQLHCTYPIVVHNQLLPPKYTLYTTTDYYKDNYNGLRSSSMDASKLFEMQLSTYIVKPGYFIRLPKFDSWEAPEPNPYTAWIFSALSLINEDDKRTLLNLRELGDIELDPDVLDWIRDSELPYITKLYTSFLHIGIYDEEMMYDHEAFFVDSDLNVKSVNDLDLRKTYRVVLSIVTDTSVVSKEAVKRLLDTIGNNTGYYDNINQYVPVTVAEKIVGTINTAYSRNPGLALKSFNVRNHKDSYNKDLTKPLLSVKDLSVRDLLVSMQGINTDWRDFYTGMKTLQFQNILALPLNKL
jgi:hypothetical protein